MTNRYRWIATLVLPLVTGDLGHERRPGSRHAAFGAREDFRARRAGTIGELTSAWTFL